MLSLFMMTRLILLRYRRSLQSYRILISFVVWCNVRCNIIASTVPDNTFNVLTREQIESYHNDGYLYIKGGLLSADLLDELATTVHNTAVIASKQRQTSGGYFSLLQSSNIFLPSSSTEVENSSNNNDNQTNHIYRKVVIDSILPKAVAELMNLDHTNGDNLRCLRDIVMSKDVNEMKTCGWHVDDIGFWPVSYHHTSGINVWMALDDMNYSGTMAIAPKSHTASWRHEAYATLGQDRTKDHGPTQQELRDAQSKHTHYLTCDMHLVNETLSNLIESSAVYIDDIERGDIIFSSRLLFHRTMAVTPEGIQYYHKQAEMTNEPQFLNRYSIRYEPGNAKINSGWNVEWSVLHDANNAGRSLNEIATLYPDLAFYPQVWPTSERIEAMDHVTQYADAWKKQAKQLVYETLFSSLTTTSATVDEITTTTDTSQYIDEKVIETG